MSKYFMYENPPVDAGQRDRQYMLITAFIEAMRLNRILVLNKLALAPNHNKGVKIPPICWTKLKDLSRSYVSVPTPNGRKRTKLKWTSYNKNTLDGAKTLSVSANHIISPAEQEHYDFIIRQPINGVSPDHRSGAFIDKTIDQFRGENFENCHFHVEPSEPIKTIAQDIINSLPKPLNVMHIRRKDLIHPSSPSYKNCLYTTCLSNIKSKIEAAGLKDSPVYLMTDEINENYINKIRQWCHLYTYKDFTSLKKLDMENNNIWLFSIEIELMHHADIFVVAEYGPRLPNQFNFYSTMRPVTPANKIIINLAYNPQVDILSKTIVILNKFRLRLKFFLLRVQKHLLHPSIRNKKRY